MSDVLTQEQRSRCMSMIKGKDTKPELLVRSLAHRLGYRFRLHSNGLPGKPDLVFPKFQKVIFVHGCFWHRHPRCRFATTPSTRQKFWQDKFEKNVIRDRKNIRDLKRLGWGVLVIWECQLDSLETLASRLVAFLE